MSHGQLAAAGLTAGLSLICSPYAARLTLTVPDRENPRWWAGRPVSRRRYAVVAVVAVILGALGGWAAGWSALLPTWIALALLCAPLVIIDFEHHRLPDRLVYPAAASTAVLLALVAVAHGDWAPLARAAAAAAVVGFIFLALALFAPFGLGDVKLGMVLAAVLGWLSWGYVLYGMLAGFIVASLVSLPIVAMRRATMKSAIPFGPALIIGTFLVAACQLVPSYLR